MKMFFISLVVLMYLALSGCGSSRDMTQKEASTFVGEIERYNELRGEGLQQENAPRVVEDMPQRTLDDMLRDGDVIIGRLNH